MERLEPFFRLKSNVKIWDFLNELRESTRFNAAKKIDEIYQRWLTVPENSLHIKNAMYIEGDLQPINLFSYLMALYQNADEMSLYDLNVHLKVYYLNINNRTRYFIEPYCWGVFAELFSDLYENNSVNIFNYDPDWSSTHPVLSELSESDIEERELVLNFIKENPEDYFTFNIVNHETLIKCDPNFCVDLSQKSDSLTEEEIENSVGEDGSQ